MSDHTRLYVREPTAKRAQLLALLSRQTINEVVDSALRREAQRLGLPDVMELTAKMERPGTP